MQPWESEIEMSSAIAKVIIEKEIAEFKVNSITPFAQGWDKTAFLVNGHLLFHFTRRQVAVAGIEAEIRLLPLIANALSIPVPVPFHSGYFSDGFPFFSYPLLEGKMIVELSLNKKQREQLAPKLAEVLKDLHNIPLSHSLIKEVPGDVYGKMNIQKRKKQILDNWHVVSNLDLAISTNLRNDLIGKVNQQIVESLQCIVHGDIYTRHILMKNGALSAVIDWGDMHLNHPARDISFAANFLHPDAFQVFQDYYGLLDEKTFYLSLFSALNHTLMVGNYALKINDKNLAHECRIAIRNIFDNYLA